jgi:hypothetical protein
MAQMSTFERNLKNGRISLYQAISRGYDHALPGVTQKGVKMSTTAIVDTAVLDELIHWIKSLTAVGVSPDTAAQVTSQFFMTACEMVAEGDEEEGEDYEDYEE